VLRLEVEERKKRAQAETERLQHDLLAASREAGLAEMATSVLHNVGNVLNSVNISTTLIGDRIRRLGIAGVGKVADLMQQHAADLGDFLMKDPKGRQVPAFLTELGHHLREQQDQIAHEVATLTEQVTHIKDIITVQQASGAVGGMFEKAAVSEIVESAIKLQTGGFTRQGIHLVRDYEELPPAMINRHGLLQIMINVLRNAKTACDGTPDKTVTVRIKRASADRFRIEVADTGVGIPPENMTKIFTHGFTTRKDGHGFGLHSSLQVATEMAGTLTAQSPGPGQGATFILELPFAAPGTVPAGPPGNAAASPASTRRQPAATS
jgi:signal transduction histidine kinase